MAKRHGRHRVISGGAVTLLKKERRVALRRFPILFTILGAFGLVATFYGFEGLIDQTDVQRDYPWLLLLLGLSVLALTGTLHKKLD